MSSRARGPVGRLAGQYPSGRATRLWDDATRGRAAAHEDYVEALCSYLKLDQYDLMVRFLRSMKVERAGYRDFLRTKKKEQSDPYRGADGDPYAGGLPSLAYAPALKSRLHKYEYHEVSKERWYRFGAPHLDLSCGLCALLLGITHTQPCLCLRLAAAFRRGGRA